MDKGAVSSSKARTGFMPVTARNNTLPIIVVKTLQKIRTTPPFEGLVLQ
jgi:hypothetical protein